VLVGVKTDITKPVVVRLDCLVDVATDGPSNTTGRFSEALYAKSQSGRAQGVQLRPAKGQCRLATHSEVVEARKRGRALADPLHGFIRFEHHRNVLRTVLTAPEVVAV
jgi:hypothetical protein